METKVYQLTPEDSVATKWSLEDTIKWYENAYGCYGEVKKEEVYERDLDRKDIWCEISGNEYDEYDEEEYEMCPFPFDGVERSLREILENEGDFEDPFIIASTEY